MFSPSQLAEVSLRLPPLTIVLPFPCPPLTTLPSMIDLLLPSALHYQPVMAFCRRERERERSQICFRKWLFSAQLSSLPMQDEWKYILAVVQCNSLNSIIVMYNNTMWHITQPLPSLLEALFRVMLVSGFFLFRVHQIVETLQKTTVQIETESWVKPTPFLLKKLPCR